MTAHAELDRLLRRTGAMVDAAECHGSLCGTLCAPAGDPGSWLERLLEGTDAPGDVRAALTRLVADTRRQLRDGDLSFSPLLPDDAERLADRVAALGEWCEGFLFGLGNAGLRDFDRLPPDAQEVVRDLVEIARVGVPTDEGAGNEEAYAELVEYLRVGVHLLHDELHPGPAPVEFQAPPGMH